MAFIATVDIDRAVAFYGDVLGLEVVSSDPYGAMLALGGVTVRINVVPGFTPAPGAVFGFITNDIAAEVAALVASGIEMTRYPGMEQDADGVWTTPGGERVAWFNDPDGNVVSLTSSRRPGSPR